MIYRSATTWSENGAGLVVGIDAGGSSTRARAMQGGTLVYEGTGGPGNPLISDQETIRASYHTALAGCPAPARVAACVSGAGSAGPRAQIADLLISRFPDAEVRVEPDYVAALLAAPESTDVCLVAGTGSIVCSRSPDGSYPASGGRGWILGDHGGAARLGRAALERFVADPDSAPGPLALEIREAFGDDNWRSVVRAVHAKPNPAPLLARFAPLLTGAAESQVPWAVIALDAEMLGLAATVAHHVDRYVPHAPVVHIALAGGVWQSPAARSSVTAALAQVDVPRPVVTRSLADPIEGAVRMAGGI